MDQDNKKVTRRKALAALGTASVGILSVPFITGSQIGITNAAGVSTNIDSSGFVNVKDFGAAGNGLIDDTQAIQSAINTGAGCILFPAGNYKVTATITIPPKVTLRGIGRLSRIIKHFNGDMVIMMDESKLMELDLDGKGLYFTGRGVVIPSGKNQKITDCAILNTQNYCVEYTETDAGVLSTIDNCFMYTSSMQSIPAVKYPDIETHGNRKLLSVDCGGGLLADFAGSANTLVTSCNTIGVIFGPSSKKVSLIGNRIAGGTLGISVDVRGENHTVIGNISAMPFYIRQGASGSVIMGNIGEVIDESIGRNKIDQASPGLTLSNNYGGISSAGSTVVFGAGGNSPDAGTISFGDGTGWKLNIGTKRNGQFATLFSFSDTGSFYLKPMANSHALKGSIFTDITDNALKFKDLNGTVKNLSKPAITYQPNSNATELATLRNDFNALLGKLKNAGLMDTK